MTALPQLGSAQSDTSVHGATNAGSGAASSVVHDPSTCGAPGLAQSAKGTGDV